MKKMIILLLVLICGLLLFRFVTEKKDETKADFDGDDTVTDADAVLLLWHILFPEQYPL